MKHTAWSHRIAFDLALVLEAQLGSVADLLSFHNISADDLLEYQKDKVFLKTVQECREDIAKNGLSFKLKARAQAEELLNTSYMLIHHPDIPASVKADLIKSTVKWAGLESPVQTGEGAGGGVKITINLGADSKPKTIEHSTGLLLDDDADDV